MKLSDYVMKYIAGLGVDKVFCVTGGGAMHLNNSLEDFFDFEEYAVGKTLMKDSIINRWYLLENMNAATLAYPDKPITIYGCGKVGKIFYRRIKPYCQVKQFIDRNPTYSDFLGVPMVSLDDAKLDEDSYIIVVPSYDLNWISRNLRDKYEFLQDDHIVSIEEFMKTGDIIDPTF